MLIAFDAAARNESFTAASRELSLTPGAVSRQVSALENQLDATLFKRVRKTIQLTDTGRQYAQEVHKVLQAIRNASLNTMTNPLNGELNLAILPTFGTRWLMPRLPEFLTENPDITLNFVTKLSPFDFHSENLHAAIHYGSADWPDTNSTFLMSEQAIPVCSPVFLTKNPIGDPSDLGHFPLLHLATRADAWGNWFQSNKIAPPGEQGMMFEQISIIARATVAGLGVALLPRFLIQSELARKELVVLVDLPLQVSSSYYLITPKEKSEYAPVEAFRNWLLNTINP